MNVGKNKGTTHDDAKLDYANVIEKLVIPCFLEFYAATPYSNINDIVQQVRTSSRLFSDQYKFAEYPWSARSTEPRVTSRINSILSEVP